VFNDFPQWVIPLQGATWNIWPTVRHERVS